LAEAGYKGEKIVVIIPTDVSELSNLARTGAEQLRRAGMNIDQQDMDAGSWFRRRVSQTPPDKGGYNMFCTLIDRSLPNVHPLGNLAIRADGKEPINGWANSPRIEELRAAWLDTTDFGAAKADLRRFAEAALGRRAVHPDGRVLAGDGVPKRFDRRPSGMFCDVLWRAPCLMC